MDNNADPESTRSASARIAEFVAKLSCGDLPEAAIRTSERNFVDTVGVSIPGALAPPAEKARHVVNAVGAGEPATLIETGDRVSITDAAFVNGVAALVLDYDDDQFTVYSHTTRQ